MKTLCFLFLALAGVALLAGTAMAQTRVGGPCQYADFPGQATIMAVAPAGGAGHGLPYAGLTVTFTFAPDNPIANEPLYVPGKTQVLTLAGGRPPGQRFVERYGVRPGRVLPCRLRLIRQGTCTPVLFDFPGIDLTSAIDLQKD
jgi:hypothetical protein